MNWLKFWYKIWVEWPFEWGTDWLKKRVDNASEEEWLREDAKECG